MIDILSEFELRLSVVPRWCIVHTIQKQSVMDHSARVAIAAPRILMRLFDIVDAESLYTIVRMALLHDQWEALSGDVAAPAKAWFDSPSFEEHMAGRVQEEYDSCIDIKSITEIKRALKMADLYEALVFINTEMKLGNASVLRIREDLEVALKRACPNESAFVLLFQEARKHGSSLQDPLR